MPAMPRFYFWCMRPYFDLDLDLDPPTPAGVLGDETFPSTPVTSQSVNTTPADSHLLKIFLEYLWPGLPWTFSSSPASIRYPLRSHTCWPV